MLREAEMNFGVVSFVALSWMTATNEAAQADIEPRAIFRRSKAPCAFIFVNEPALQIISVVILVPMLAQALSDNFHSKILTKKIKIN